MKEGRKSIQSVRAALVFCHLAAGLFSSRRADQTHGLIAILPALPLSLPLFLSYHTLLTFLPFRV